MSLYNQLVAELATTGKMAKTIKKEFEHKRRDENLARLKNVEVVQKMLVHLPLQYLYSKPDLRHYALERVLRRLLKLHAIKIRRTLRYSFGHWKRIPSLRDTAAEDEDDFTATLSTEKKFGIMVLAAAFTEIGKNLLRKKFQKWVHGYCARFNPEAARVANLAAMDIQQWYMRIKYTKNKEYRQWTNAVQVCIHRRKAIKYMIKFEMIRRQALAKLRNGVAYRRRYFYAARVLQRQFRWLLLYRQTKYRLVRLTYIRRIQRWRRMAAYRSTYDKMVIKMILRLGGYSAVYAKLPEKYTKLGTLKAFDVMVSDLQKAWFKSCGKLALFERFAARKREMAYQQMLNDNALVIQNSYRAHLWDKLILVAFQYNRARRIQRGFRAYQYRHWVLKRVVLRRNRFAKKLQRWMVHNLRFLPVLRRRFVKRKLIIIEYHRKRLVSSETIQRGFRCYVARKRVQKARELARFEKIRNNYGAVVATASKIQRNWRQMKPPYRFPRHVYLLMQRLERERRKPLFYAAVKIQRLAQEYLLKLKERREKRISDAVYVLFHLFKAYLLKQALYYRVEITRKRRLKARNTLCRNLRTLTWMRAANVLFSVRKMEMDYERLRNKCAATIQYGLHKKFEQHYMAVRVAGRKQLHKRRKRDAYEAFLLKLKNASLCITKLLRGNRSWNNTLRLIEKKRIWLKRHRAAKKMQRFGRSVINTQRYNDATRMKYEKIAAQLKRIKYIHNANIIGHYYKRYCEKKVLAGRFFNRWKMLEEYRRLEEERAAAEELKRLADEEVARTEDNMNATIDASWKQGSDTQGRNYYYNFITGESRWEPPENWKMKPLDQWIRQKDERGNIYYYNQQTEESRWLPPCSICGDEGEKWCSDCNVAYCEKDYEELHEGEDADEVMRVHTWSAVEYDRDILQPGEVFCLECKRKRSTRMCTTCWDPYCDECFRYVHRAGALRFHKSIPYRRAKQGWMCVKGRMEGEKDYYVNGATGETTFEKPQELMTPDELTYYTNFQAHKAAAEEHVAKITKLQFDLEAVSYERDTILFDQLKASAQPGDVGKKNKPKGRDSKQAASDMINSALKGGVTGLLGMITGGTTNQYRQAVLKPDDRSRGKQRSDMIQKLIQEAPPSAAPPTDDAKRGMALKKAI